jgi:hypothetical protein
MNFQKPLSSVVVHGFWKTFPAAAAMFSKTAKPG